MSYRRLAFVLPIVAVILGGCELRGTGGNVAEDEARDEQGRIAEENARLANENLKLKNQLEQARGTLNSRGSGTIGENLDIGGIASNIEGASNTGDGAVALSDDFSFAKGSADLTGAGRASIEQLANRLNSGVFANATIIVEGHTDSTPVARAATREKFGDNLGLSKARAQAVVEALVEAGVSRSRLLPVGLGDTRPRATGKSKDDLAKNRRVELRVQFEENS